MAFQYRDRPPKYLQKSQGSSIAGHAALDSPELSVVECGRERKAGLRAGGPAQGQHTERDGLGLVPHEAIIQRWPGGRRKHPLGIARKSSRPWAVMQSPRSTLLEASPFR